MYGDGFHHHGNSPLRFEIVSTVIDRSKKSFTIVCIRTKKIAKCCSSKYLGGYAQSVAGLFKRFLVDRNQMDIFANRYLF